MENYKGCIVEESLDDNRVLNGLEMANIKITDEEKPEERGQVYGVYATEDKIDYLSEHIKEGWYMHFWKDDKMIVIFKGKSFKFNFNDKSMWKPVVDYGLSLGIPKEQLGFQKEF